MLLSGTSRNRIIVSKQSDLEVTAAAGKRQPLVEITDLVLSLDPSKEERRTPRQVEFEYEYE